MEIVGLSAEIRYGYQVAATLGRWRAAPNVANAEDVFMFSAAVAGIDEYWITVEPLQLMLRVGRTYWMWDNVTFVRDGQQIHATLLGRPKVEPA